MFDMNDFDEDFLRTGFKLPPPHTPYSSPWPWILVVSVFLIALLLTVGWLLGSV
jgi:hypothetical protein